MDYPQTNLFGDNSPFPKGLSPQLKWLYQCLRVAKEYSNPWWWDDLRNSCPPPPVDLRDYGRTLSRFLIGHGFEKLPNEFRASTIPSRQRDTSYKWQKKGGY